MDFMTETQGWGVAEKRPKKEKEVAGKGKMLHRI